MNFLTNLLHEVIDKLVHTVHKEEGGHLDDGVILQNRITIFVVPEVRCNFILFESHIVKIG